MKNSTYLIFVLLSLIFFAITFCSNTSPQIGSLTGTIQLEGETDYSNITAAIYKLATLDPDIVAINQEYPHIGVIINQTTEFDHRFGTLVKTGETDASGYFKIKDISTGIYNVVAIKDFFGLRYIYNVQINNGNNSLHAPRSTLHASRSSDITLFPETTITADITEATTFESYHHYIIEPEFGNNITISGDLIIKHCAVIRIEKDKKLTISGDLTAVGEEDNFIWFTVNDSILPLSQSPRHSLVPSPPRYLTLSQFNRVELDGTFNKEVAYCKFDHAGTGLLSRVNGFEISDCIFRESQCGFKAEGVDSAFCINLLCENITNEDGGIYFSSYINGGDIKNNVIKNCTIGIKTKDDCNPDINNNYINQCDLGLELLKSNSIVHNNEIINCIYGIRIAGTTTPLINYNTFDNDIAVYIGGYSWYYPNSQPEIHQNNIKSMSYCFYLTFLNSFDINAENNYYYTTDDEKIQELIFDKNNIEPPHQEDYGIVFYDPFLIQEVQNAGIQE